MFSLYVKSFFLLKCIVVDFIFHLAKNYYFFLFCALCKINIVEMGVIKPQASIKKIFFAKAILETKNKKLNLILKLRPAIDYFLEIF